MEDSGKSREELLAELRELRQRVTDLEQRQVRATETMGSLFTSGPLWLTLASLEDDALLDVNQAFLDHFGFVKDEVLGRTPVDLGLWDSSHRGEYINQLKRTGSVENREMALKSKTGDPRPSIVGASIIVLNGAKYLITAGLAVPERAVTEGNLLIGEVGFRMLVETMNQGLTVLDKNGMVTFVNHQMCELLGYREDEVIGIPATKFVDEENRTILMDQLSRRAEGDDKTSYEITLKTKSEGSVKVIAAVSSVRDSEGRFLGSFGVVTDITERKRIEEELRESEAKYKALIETTGTGYMIADTQGRILDANLEYVRLTGHDNVEQILGRSVIERTAEYDRERGSAEIEKCLEQGFVKSFEVDHIDLDGNAIPVEVNATVTEGKDGICFINLCREITDRKKVEDALRTNERRLAEAQRVGRIGDWEWNALTNEAFWSDEMYRIFGVLPEAFRLDYDAHLRFIPPEDVEEYEAILRSCLASKEPCEYEHRVVTPNGETKTVWVHCHVKVNKDGEPIGLWGTTQDITARKAAEEALIESESRFRRVLEQAADAIFVHDFHGRFLEVNRVACERLGYTRDELLSMSVYDLDPEAAPRDDKTLHWSNLPATFEATNMRKDGSVFSIEVSLGPIDWGKQKVILGLVRDITDRKKAEDELRRSEELYRNVYNHAPLGLVVWDTDYRILDWNDEAARMFGWSREEAVGSNLVDLIVHEKNRSFVRRLMSYLLEGRIDRQIIDESVTKSGESIWCEWNAAPLHDSEGQVVGAISLALDITERKRAEDELRASLKEKEVLFREIHHRVKNNLAVIASLLRLQSHNAKDAFHREMFEDAQNRIQSMALAHERLYGSGNLALVDMREYVPSLVDHLAFRTEDIGKKIELRKEIGAVQLELEKAIPVGFLVNELVSNALKHAFVNRDGGTVTIGLTCTEKNECELIVRDDGIGMPEKVDFENPTSFGLNLAKLVVEQLEGVIELSGSQGTEFRIRFGSASGPEDGAGQEQ